jgi:hypothetical protein
VLWGKPSSEHRVVDGEKKGFGVLLNWNERCMKMEASVTKQTCQTKVLCEEMGWEGRQERVDGDYFVPVLYLLKYSRLGLGERVILIVTDDQQTLNCGMTQQQMMCIFIIIIGAFN